MDRRKFLTVSGVSLAVGLSGCSSTDTGDENAAQATPEPEELLNERVRVSEDDYRGWRFSLNRDATLDYEFTVREGPAVDIFVMEDQEYSHMRSGERFYSQGDAGTNGGGLISLTADKEWAFVVDNTNTGDAAPPTNFDDDTAVVDVEAYLTG